LALRQTEGLIGSVLQLLNLDLPVPDHSTLSRRAATLQVPRPKAGSAPVHLLVDSTGLKFCGPGEWLVEKHGTKRRRAWRVLHLATFGILNKHNPLFSYVELASGGGHDGRLEVHEIFGLNLTADLVVLSACQTGIGSGSLADVPAADDWVGLNRAFLQAGASRIVATLWSVEDWSTASFMDRFYGEYSTGGDPVRALADAQRAALATSATAHPFAWAGFIIVGGAVHAGPGN